MRIGFTSKHRVNDEDVPTGGETCGRGFTIAWQDGALGRDDNRVAPNGAFVEDVIDAVRDRIAHFQTAGGGRFACDENEEALAFLDNALSALDDRTKRREAAGVEGTHTGETDG